MAILPVPVATTPQPARLLDLVRKLGRDRFGPDGPGGVRAD